MGLARSGSVLVDTRSTTLEPVNDGVFTVATNAVRLEGYGITGSDFIQIQVLVGPDQDDALWTDLILGGQSIRLDQFNTQRIIMLSGKYRAHYGGEGGEVFAYSEQDNLDLDKNVFYNYEQPSNNSTGGGFALTALETNSFNMQFAGDTSGGDVYGNVKISADPGNIIATHVDGLYAAGGFNLPFLEQSDNFAADDSNFAYRCVAASESTLTVSLPAAADSASRFYIVEAAGLGTVAVAPDGTDIINSVNTPVTIPTGAACWLYCNGVDGWSMILGGAIA